MYRAAQTTTLLGDRGKGDKERHIMLILLLSPIIDVTSYTKVAIGNLGTGFTTYIYALISDHPGGLPPWTYRGITRFLLTFVANFWPGTGAYWTGFVLLVQDTREGPAGFVTSPPS